MRAFIQEVTQVETDDGNGNKRTHKKTLIRKREKVDTPFCLMMLKDLGRLYDLQDHQIKVFIKMVSNMDYDNVVRVSGYDRKEWPKDLRISYKTLSVAISKLKSAGLIRMLGAGAYQIDPEIFNMGTLDSGIEKSKKYNAFFKITYIDGPRGVERKTKIFRVQCEEEIDVETGEVLDAKASVVRAGES